MKCSAINKDKKPCGVKARAFEAHQWWCYRHVPSGKYDKQTLQGCVLPLWNEGLSWDRFIKYCELTGGENDSKNTERRS